MEGLRNAITKQDAACIPPESLKISMLKPRKKLTKRNTNWFEFTGYNKINRMYT